MADGLDIIFSSDLLPIILLHLNNSDHNNNNNDSNPLYAPCLVNWRWNFLATPLLYAKPKIGPNVKKEVWRRFLRSIIYSAFPLVERHVLDNGSESTLRVAERDQMDDPAAVADLRRVTLPLHTFIRHLSDIWLYVGGEDDVPEDEQLYMLEEKLYSKYLADRESSSGTCDKNLTHMDSGFGGGGGGGGGILIPSIDSVSNFPAYSMSFSLALFMEICPNLKHLSLQLHSEQMASLAWSNVLSLSIKSNQNTVGLKNLDIRTRVKLLTLKHMLTISCQEEEALAAAVSTSTSISTNIHSCHLQSLSLGWAESFDDSSLDIISASCPRLKHLSITLINESSFRSSYRRRVVRNYLHEEITSAFSGPKITDEGMLKFIENLSSQNCASSSLETFLVHPLAAVTSQCWLFFFQSFPHLARISLTLNSDGGVTPEWLISDLLTSGNSINLTKLEIFGAVDSAASYSSNGVIPEDVVFAIPETEGCKHQLKELELYQLDFSKSNNNSYSSSSAEYSSFSTYSSYYGISSGGSCSMAWSLVSELMDRFRSKFPHIHLKIKDKKS